ncbi:Riboflavin transporter RfnT [Streptomyces sp. enrichment culture]|uniref:MFS transporter n=1 Tax=Streptomyces sp. enrichment culture TaxID=1795815 RepID=UPI003F54625C
MPKPAACSVPVSPHTSNRLPETGLGRSVPETQKRILTVLLISQILSGAGLAAGITVGALLYQDMLGSTTLAGLPSALLTGGSALAAVAIGRISQARGRRPGLAAGYVVGALGSAGVVAAATLDSPVLLFVSLVLYGAGTAANLQARYAGADLAAPAYRARAVSTALVATTLGGVLGPNLATPAGRAAEALGLPSLTGLFLLSCLAYALAAVVLTAWLRPDPLLLARTLSGARKASGGAKRMEAQFAHRGPGLLVGVLVMGLSQLVMVAVMTMTPVHLHDHGHGTAASGLVIGLHVGAMYLPSPLTGFLVDRYGSTAVVTGSALTLLTSGILAACAPGDSVALSAVALVLLGLGWNSGLVSGTAIVTQAAPAATRARTQGLADVAVAIAGAVGGLLSGLVVAAAGYPVLAIAGGALALAILPAVMVAALRIRQGQGGNGLQREVK